MPKTDKWVDAYIAKAAPFAQPILKHIRELIHKACPDVEETIKWGFSSFDYHGAMCSMASFKKHCAFGFWKAAIMSDPNQLFLEEKRENAMGHLGQITSLKDLPADKVMIAYIKEAAKLNKEGVKLPPRKVASEKEKAKMEVPADLVKALSKNKQAQAVFNEFSYSNKKEYVMWVEEAKTDETRKKRIDTTVEWVAEGKIRNWKYLKK